MWYPTYARAGPNGDGERIWMEARFQHLTWSGELTAETRENLCMCPSTRTLCSHIYTLYTQCTMYPHTYTLYPHTCILSPHTCTLYPHMCALYLYMCTLYLHTCTLYYTYIPYISTHIHCIHICIHYVHKYIYIVTPRASTKKTIQNDTQKNVKKKLKIISKKYSSDPT